MFEYRDFGLVVCFSVFLYVLFHLKTLIISFESRLNDAIEDINKTDVALPSLNDLKDEILDVVNSTIENLQPPTAFDHIAGAVGQYFQMRMMKEMQALPQIDMIENVVDAAQGVADLINND